MNVPALRFPEFSGEWEEKRIGDVLHSHKLGGNYSNSLEPTPWPLIKMGNLKRGKMDVSKVEYIEVGEEIDPDDLIKGGDLFFNTRNTLDLVGKVAIWREELPTAYYNSNLMRLVFDCNEFMNIRLNSYSGIKSLKRVAAGTTSVAAIYTKDFLSVKASAPLLPEQKKIAAFLGVVDTKIAALRDRRAGLERYKRGLMQALFSQTLRFTKDDGSAFPDWEEKRLGEVLHEHKAKSTGKEEVFSVSVHKGLVNQIEHLGRSFSAASTDHYNRVKQFDVVYTKSPTGDFPLGIIKQSYVAEDVIVSPLYGVFTPVTPALGRILHVHFESNINVSNYLGPIVQKGAKNTINVTNLGFLSNKLTLPVSPDEQGKIADALSAVDTKIAAVGDQLGQMETFKKGLLQQMFV
ncbi:MAG: restriction endonuclease subunit S [Yoonia sp.]|uniref:restriction endonuclease subunit S n=1 Tax=Yoonia sp. TaxID=2212373 RepID=UPI0032651403